MKKILLLIVSVFMTGSLVYGQTGKVIHINQSEFIEKVYDYKKNPDKWVYEGSKPAIVDFTPTGADLAAGCPPYWRSWQKNIRIRL